jgi:hypothetical protein
VTTTSADTSVGEMAIFTYTMTAPNAIEVGEEYTVRLIDLDRNAIVWEDTLTAKGA